MLYDHIYKGVLIRTFLWDNVNNVVDNIDNIDNIDIILFLTNETFPSQ